MLKRLPRGGLCEGWGAADALTGTSGFANIAVDGVVGMTLVSFTSNATTATSVVNISDKLQVKHFYHPSVSPNLYQVDVSIKNIGSTPVELLYRRVMDWDVEPTYFNEFVTINTGTATNISFTSNDGFASANPLSGPSNLGFTGSFTDAGPNDHGTLFDFNFGMLVPGATKEFKIFYGAAANEMDANVALADVGAEAFSFGQPNTPDGPTLGIPNTFIFAFSGTPIVQPAPGKISGMKFADLNGNGINDGEPGLMNWEITLTNESGAITTMLTDVNGMYNFSNLPDGNYIVGETLQAGWVQTAPRNGTYSVKIMGGSNISDIDFGNFKSKDVKIAVILAEPSDDSHNPVHDKNYYLTNSIPDLKDYYKEVSYGAVNITINPEDVYDNNSNWYKLGKTAAYYGKNIAISDNSSQFLLDTVEAADSDVNFSKYDAVIVIHANKSQQESGNWDLMTTHAWMSNYITKNGDIAKNLILNSEYELMGTWAHETGHAMGRILVPGKGDGYLPDRYGDKDGKHSIGDWDLMGSGNWLGNPRGSNPDHMSSFSKKWLDWLKYSSVGYGTYWINSLSTMNYGDGVTRFITANVTKINLTSYYIIETRTNNPAYSRWDTSAPIPYGYSNALVLYEVEEKDKNSTVNYITNLLPREGFWDSSYWDFASKVRFKALEERNRTSGTKPIFEMKVEIQNFSSSWIVGAILESIDNLMGYIPPYILSPPLNSEAALPDLDLHAYTPDGKHIGVNYTTGVYENEIPGANASGDLLNGREWIFVPDNIKVQFVVDSRDNQGFLKSYPELQQITNGTQSYNLSIVYDVPDDIRYATSVEQSVQPDEIWKYNYLIAKNTDGTYNVEVETIPPEIEKPLHAVVKIEPRTLNINSNGKLIEAEIRIPGYDASLIDVTSIRLNGIIPVDIKSDEITEDDEKHVDGSKLKVKFDRIQVQSVVGVGDVSLYISGKVNGETFMGSDTIRVIGSAKKDDKPKSKRGKL